MKTQFDSKRFILFLFVIALFSCINDDEYSIPIAEDAEVILSGEEISFEALRSALDQEIEINGNNLLRFDSDSYISGYVISNDEKGNFFEELIVQDHPTNGNRGIKILLDVSPLYQHFEFGRKIHVKLSGLTVGLSSGQLTLGIRDGNRLGTIPESSMFDFVIRDPEVITIEPVVRKISELSESNLNTYTRLNDVQFNRNEALGEEAITYAGEPSDEFDGERLLESCVENATVIFSTSTFADFKSVKLAQGRGSIEGIFTYNFFGDEFNMVVNDLDGVQLDGTDRCDPIEVDCGVAPASGANILFSDFFETQTKGEPITGDGWTNFIEAGTESWEAYFDAGTNASLGISARIGSFMSGDDSSIGWLITPQLDFSSSEAETLQFKTSNSFADGSTLEVLFSADWNGKNDNIVKATWDLLPAAIIVSDDDFFGDWISSGIVDLSCIEGSGYIAWKYVGSGEEDFDGTYELDEIEIRSE